MKNLRMEWNQIIPILLKIPLAAGKWTSCKESSKSAIVVVMRDNSNSLNLAGIKKSQIILLF